MHCAGRLLGPGAHVELCDQGRNPPSPAAGTSQGGDEKTKKQVLFNPSNLTWTAVSQGLEGESIAPFRFN